MGAPAWSQTYVGVTPPTVAPEQIVQTPTTQAPASSGGIAFTGADIAELVAIAAFGISAGMVTVRMGRARVKPVAAH